MSTKISLVSSQLIDIPGAVKYNKIKERERMEKTTDELMNEIRNTHEIEKFLEKNSGEFTEKPLCDLLDKLLKERKLQKSKVVARSGLNRIYGYQILSGKRVPSRDKLIALCFGMQLDLAETDDMMKYAGYRNARGTRSR